MRVTFPASLDTFSHAPECPCALARLPDDTPDFPLRAVATPEGATLTFATLCPSVRAQLLAADEPVIAATSAGGWRQPLHLWQPEGDLTCRLIGDFAVPWDAFVALRDVLLECVADPQLPILARLAKVALTTDHAREMRALPEHASPLTARGFLAFCAHFEARCAAVHPTLAPLFAHLRAVLPELDVDPTLLAAALSSPWQPQAQRWLPVDERGLLPAWEAWLGVRLLALPSDRDQTLVRSWAELLEAPARALRFAVALAEVQQSPLTPQALLAALALVERQLVVEPAALPLFDAPRDTHTRSPQLFDLDLSLACLR